jgi:hypothetical protein
VQVLSRNKKYVGNKNPEENPGLDGKHDGPREQSAHKKKKKPLGNLYHKQMIYF